MKLATITLKTNQLGSTIIRTNVTPAEAMFLVAQFHADAGGDPIKGLELGCVKVGRVTSDGLPLLIEDGKDKGRQLYLPPLMSDDKWSTSAEKTRLSTLYGRKRVDALFPGKMPEMPIDFEEARALGLDTQLPSARLVADHGITET